MNKKIFYWSPCLNPVGTVKSTLNSAISLIQYGGNKYDVSLINACGEWDEYEDVIKSSNIKLINFKFKYFKYLPKTGFIQSRFSYLIIFFISFFQLLTLLKKSKPNFLVAHLITSLPLIIMVFNKLDTKFILRISGLPKLNFFRRNLWALTSKKIFSVTCPSEELKKRLISLKLFDHRKLFFLPDAILDIKTYLKFKQNEISDKILPKNEKYIVAAGRLTKQKNFSYLILEFEKFLKKNKEYSLLILGEGEERNNLELLIKRRNLNSKIFLFGYVKNVYSFFNRAEVFVLSSLWEEVGFVIVEAAISNLFVISSNCPNGPKEFLDDEKNGILFENNKNNALMDALTRYHKLDKKKERIIMLKKNAKKYTKFRHYLIFEKILQN